MDILIIEDHPVSQIGIKEIIQERFDKATLFIKTRTEILKENIVLPKIDLIILGTGNDQYINLETWKHIQKNMSAIPTIIFCITDDYQHFIKFLREGARGIVFKHQDASEFLESITDVLNGIRCINHQALALIAEYAISEENKAVNKLTSKELLIARELSLGSRTMDIAFKFGLTSPTVSIAKSKIFTKLEVKNIAELAQKLRS
jgi:two-component system response regulator EvgA